MTILLFTFGRKNINKRIALDKSEFKILFDNYFGEIRRYLFFKSGDEDLATDLAQDIFVKLWEKQIVIIPETVRPLLYKMANNSFISQYRKEKTKFKFFEVYTPDNEDLSPEDELGYNELLQAYEKALAEMPERQRSVFLMSRVDNLKYQEIADRLGIGVKAVEKRMSFALAYMRKALKGKYTSMVLWMAVSTYKHDKILLNMDTRNVLCNN